MVLEKIDQLAREWLEEAGNRIFMALEQTNIEVEAKSDRNDLVTNVDKSTERYFAEKIAAHFPDHRLLGEEGYGEEITSLEGVVWVLDPIDGTVNFVEQKRNFAISLGIYKEGIGELAYIYDIIGGEFYFAKRGEGAFVNDVEIPKLSADKKLEDALVIINTAAMHKFPQTLAIIKEARGLRLYGAATLEYMAVATGRADAYISANLAPWDIGAGKIIAEEVGAIVTRVDGTPMTITEKGASFVASPGVHAEILRDYLGK
ncbi:inositol monophosphatase family protein [Listeria weihenstephanensis]|uniref:Inositol monophosphatase family protein n=1 Tax=Listeria weihenstephanensis TaxID=1006155 RepID=A0A841Z6I7_9LIST|nr:inositol monophosphatase family protein [Listeria weihenstephanensis]MBC1500479.1 inositol monophosphatase family protein [Listeria weihenstephanensis]